MKLEQIGSNWFQLDQIRLQDSYNWLKFDQLGSNWLKLAVLD